MLYEFALMDFEKGWTQQYHLGVLRNNNSRMFRQLGPDTGFDSIGTFEIARPLSRLLDRLDSAGKLARTILYNLHPGDNELLVTMMNNFQDGSVPGKLQHGSAWWVLDQKEGMERQMKDLSQTGLLSRFVGMLTDSRSFLSYTRHEYFRRVLCNMLGADMAEGTIPDEPDMVGRMVSDICYNNAASYFGFDMGKK
jgi:glucuronate isomerase